MYNTNSSYIVNLQDVYNYVSCVLPAQYIQYRIQHTLESHEQVNNTHLITKPTL